MIAKISAFQHQVGQMVDEEFVVHQVKVAMLERDLAVHCGIKRRLI